MSRYRVVLQLFKEFWFPFVGAIGWSTYILHRAEAPSIALAVSTFAPSFFLVSWMTGQLFRVAKQERLQDSLGALEARLSALVDRLDETSREIAGYATGGDSFCYVGAGEAPSRNEVTWTYCHHGRFPMFGISVRITDLDDFERRKLGSGNPFAADVHEEIGDLPPNTARPGRNLNLGPGSARNFNIFFAARNGHYAQLLRLRRVNDSWVYASIVRSSEGKVFAIRVDKRYPRSINGMPEGLTQYDYGDIDPMAPGFNHGQGHDG